MVRPAYKAIKLMGVLNYIPLSLNLKTGNLIYEGRLRTRFIHNTVFYFSVLKVVQISYTLARMLLDFKMEDLHIVILTTLWLSLLGTSTYWAYELFHKGLQETIILFNSLEFEPETRLTDKIWRWGSNEADLKGNLSWVKAIVRSLLSLNLQELMCVSTPFLIKSSALLYIVIMFVFPDWNIFATSLIYSYDGGWWPLVMGSIVFIEIWTAFFMEANITFLFYFQLALQVTHLARVETLLSEMGCVTFVTLHLVCVHSLGIDTFV